MVLVGFSDSFAKFTSYLKQGFNFDNKSKSANFTKLANKSDHTTNYAHRCNTFIIYYLVFHHQNKQVVFILCVVLYKRKRTANHQAWLWFNVWLCIYLFIIYLSFLNLCSITVTSVFALRPRHIFLPKLWCIIVDAITLATICVSAMSPHPQLWQKIKI